MIRYYWSLLILVGLYCPETLEATEYFETFLKPNQVVDMASRSLDRLAVLHVKEGEHVQKGQLLAEFDSRVMQARLNLAKTAIGFHGNLDSAQALVDQRKSKLAVLLKLRESSNARPQEIDSARTGLAMAKAQYLNVQEMHTIKKAELAVIAAQFEEKKLRSPLDGLVLKIYKQEAELVGGSEQQAILTLVQLDPLLAVFHLPLALISDMQVGKSAFLKVSGDDIQAEIDFISPVIEPQSGTVTVRFLLPNQDGRFVSGSRVIFTPDQSPVNQ